ncbi:MAG: M56 family metallopeptidase [Fuerstiella sp.]
MEPIFQFQIATNHTPSESSVHTPTAPLTHHNSIPPVDSRDANVLPPTDQSGRPDSEGSPPPLTATNGTLPKRVVVGVASTETGHPSSPNSPRVASMPPSGDSDRSRESARQPSGFLTNEMLVFVSRLSWAVWLIVSSVMCLRIGLSWYLSRARIAQSRPATHTEQRRFFALAAQLANHPVAVRVSEQPAHMPVCVGIRRPTIILPREVPEWDDRTLKPVLNHELAHAIRGDAWINVVAQLQGAVLWFHPFSLLLNRRLRQDCEIACDDWAMSQGIAARDYARVLLNVSARFQSGNVSLCHPMAARSSSLHVRIKSVMEPSKARLPMAKRYQKWTVSIFALATLLVSSIWVDFTSAQQSIPARVSSTGGQHDDSTHKPNPSSAIHTASSVVKAVNLGNWLLLEPWLLDINDDDLPDQSTVLTLLNKRFGSSRTQKLLATYRQNWITLADLQAARSMGFNAVRLPFDCGLLESPDGQGDLRKDAFRWTDHAVKLCEQAGLSVILDLHAAPGGQSLDGPSGDASANRLWTDENARNRTVRVWQKMAERYADNESVIAYDVLNEPYGDFDQDLRQPMLDLFSRLYESIRKVDPNTLIYAPATLDGFAFYGDPAERGWRHVGFTQHAYPGLFDGRPAAVRSHEMFLKHWVESVDRMVDRLNVPFLLGEYNVVFEDAGGAALTAWYSREYERRGWSTAIWTLKRLLREPSSKANSWSLLTNSVGIHIDLKTDSYEELVQKLTQMGSVSWHADRKFSQALEGNSNSWEWSGRDPWQSVEIETDVAGSSIVRGENWVLQAAGRDIFGERDRFYFRCRPAVEVFHASARVLWLDETSPWAKAGWMIRSSLSADAAHLLIHCTPDGQILICGRDKPGQASWQKVVGLGGLPVQLGISREYDQIHFTWTDGSGQTGKQTFSPSFLTDNLDAVVGVAACSLTPGVQTTVGLDRVAFQSLRSDGSAANFDVSDTTVALASRAALPASPQNSESHRSESPNPVRETPGKTNISTKWSAVAVKNPSFEIPGQSTDTAADWNRWGDWMNRETEWAPVRDGKAVIGYHHYQIEKQSDSGLWQNVTVTPGESTRFRIQANADIGKNGAFAKSVELRLEVPGKDGSPIKIGSKTYLATQIATGDRWSTLEVVGTPESDVVRLIVRVLSAEGESVARDGSLKFDAVEVSQRPRDQETKTRNGTQRTVGVSKLKNGSFENAHDDGQIDGWSGWGNWLGRQDDWKPVREGKAILAYQHYRTDGTDNSGVWQNTTVSKGAKVTFSVFANFDPGKPGTQSPRSVELKLESPRKDGKSIVLATKKFEASHLARDGKWSQLSLEATALDNIVRCLIIVEPAANDGQRDGAVKFDEATVHTTKK